METRHRPEIEPQEMVFGKVIGEGTYGVVYEGVCRALPVAIKKPRKQTLDLAERDDILREIAVMSAITHPNVCLFLGACIQPNNILIGIQNSITTLHIQTTLLSICHTHTHTHSLSLSGLY
jgi:serine/threonine protein kinase